MPVGWSVKMRAAGRWAIVAGVSRLLRRTSGGVGAERGILPGDPIRPLCHIAFDLALRNSSSVMGTTSTILPSF
jgi:hypothetical protein